MEAIILAGGFGRRLRSKVTNVPKPMANINGKPFLTILLDYLSNHNIETVIISAFYKNEYIKKYFKYRYKNINIKYSIDEGEYGTGGAVKNAFEKCITDNIYVINGDTYYNVDLRKLYKEHIRNENHITMSVKPMHNFKRYGNVIFNSNYRVVSFKQSSFIKYGNINGGVYLIRNEIFDSEKKIKFSLEEYISNNLNNINVGSFISNELFIDIGTPEDYVRSQKILEKLI